MKKKTFVFAAMALFAAAASAQQYKWTDKDGKVRYGDVPPPGVTTTKLKAPSPPPAAAAATPDAKKTAPKAKEPEKQAMTEEQLQVKRENCALQAGTDATMALVSGSSAVLDEGVRTPRRTGRFMAVVSGWDSALSTFMSTLV